jgi:hypothetical protein
LPATLKRLGAVSSGTGILKSYIRLSIHYHSNKFINWIMKKSARLRVREDGEPYLDVYFEKPSKKKKKEGECVGLDCG